MPLADRINQRALFVTAAVDPGGGDVVAGVVPSDYRCRIALYLLMQFGGGFGRNRSFSCGARSCSRLAARDGAGVTFAVVRIGLGLWSFFVPVLTATGFKTLAWILTGFWWRVGWSALSGAAA